MAISPRTLLLLLAALVVASCAYQAQDAPAPVAVADPPGAIPNASPYLRAAHWFGSGWPVNFWNTDLESRAEADFRAIREDGFNAVVLVVPWRGFAPDSRSGVLDAKRVDRLLGLMRLAARMELNVILRVSFAWDSMSQESGNRLIDLWVDDAVQRGWLDHIGALWAATSQEPNLLFGFFSWEDLWAVTELAEVPPELRVLAAQRLGFRRWLEGQYSLSEVEQRYRTHFASWDEVPVPGRREPAFKLLLEFIDDAWLRRFFLPAQQRFAALSMEVRIDADPVWDGDTLLEWHSHEAAWNLPGAGWTTLYWSPSMGGINQGEELSPQLAAERLQGTLQRVLERTGGRPIFIGQFLAEDYTPGYEMNGRIRSERIGDFLAAATKPLQQLASGYGLWTWRDYHHDAIANREFYAGFDGWDVSPGVRRRAGGAELSEGDSLTTAVSVHAYHAPGGPQHAEFCVSGSALAAPGAALTLVDVEHETTHGRLQFDHGASTTACVELPVAPLMRLRLTAEAPVQLQRISSSGSLQRSGMRDADNQPKPVALAYRELNRSLRSAPWIEVPLYADGWMGRSISQRMTRPATAEAELRFTTHLPPDWPAQPKLAVTIDGERSAEVECSNGGVVVVPLPDKQVEQGAVRLRIEGSHTHQPPSDGRELACLLSGLRVESVSPVGDYVR